MSASHDKRRILCFGDSNTWGYIPREDDIEERYPVHIRWTGVLQKKLGDSVQIIEEGLNGRTTGLEDPDRPGRNGFESLISCLKTHVPLDLVILMLGTNDLKLKFQADPLEIAVRMRNMVRKTKEIAKSASMTPSQILMVSAVVPDPVYAYDDFRYEEIQAIGRQMNLHYAKMAEGEKIPFLNLGEEVVVSPGDGVHLDAGAHRKLAELIAQWVTRH